MSDGDCNDNICYCIIHSPELLDSEADCTFIEPELEDDVY